MIFAVLFVVIAIDIWFGGDADRMTLVFWGGFCALFAAAFVLTRQTMELFSFGDEHLSIYRRNAADQKLMSFIDTLQKRKLAFFKQRISRRAGEFPPEEISGYLLYLRESDLVDEAGYGELKAYLDGFDSGGTYFGFR